MTNLSGHTVFDHLAGAGVPLSASAVLADGLAAAVWDRDTGSAARYERPGHHTLSLYVSGGEGYARRVGRGLLPSLGSGSLCVMPQGATSDWEFTGAVRLFHLYVSRRAFERAVAETLDTDPARVRLCEATYVRDPVLEGVVRGALLPLRWDEPAERVALCHAGHALVALLAARMTDRLPRALARGGIAAAALRRVAELVEARLADPLAVEDLAAAAGLSAFHFARAFKQATGETPHRFVLRRRLERAKQALACGEPPARVAAACGFSSQSHFGARFREATGLTPGSYARVFGR